VGHVRASGKNDACGTRTGLAKGVSRYPLGGTERATMAASTKKCAATSKAHVGVKKQVSSKEATPNPAAEPKPARESVRREHLANDKNLKLADALREEGIGVRKLAQGFATLHDKLGRSDDKGDLKLFFDVLKDNHRTLEPPGPPDRSSADENVTVVLKHNVPRPVR
jgi:hypothetical protein